MKAATSLIAVAFALLACSKPQEPSLQNFTLGMQQYLEQRGALCLGKTVWPLAVTDRAAQAGDRDGVQMPVLERLGLVTSVAAAVTVTTEDGATTLPGRSYQLTEAGKRYYVVRASPGVDGDVRQQGDFCPVRLSLDKVASFELEGPPQKAQHAVVSYRYRVEAAAWLSDPEAKRVFPAVAHVIAGAGSAELKEGFSLTRDGWVANDVLGASAAAPVGAEKVAQRR